MPTFIAFYEECHEQEALLQYFNDDLDGGIMPYINTLIDSQASLAQFINLLSMNGIIRLFKLHHETLHPLVSSNENIAEIHSLIEDEDSKNDFKQFADRMLSRKTLSEQRQAIQAAPYPIEDGNSPRFFDQQREYQGELTLPSPGR